MIEEKIETKEKSVFDLTKEGFNLSAQLQLLEVKAIAIKERLKAINQEINELIK